MRYNIMRILFAKYGKHKIVNVITKMYTLAIQKNIFKKSELRLLRFYGGCDFQQSTHPDIFWDEKIERYILTISYYPYGIGKYENPYVFSSQDGNHFYNCIKGPIVQYQGNGKSHYSDSDIIKVDNVYYLYYRYCDITPNSSKDIIYLKESTDLVSWKNEVLVTEKKADRIISPAIVYSGKFYMYYVDIEDAKSRLVRISSETADFSLFEEELIEIENIPSGYMLWHIDVSMIDNKYYGAFTFSKGLGGAEARLFLAIGNSEGNKWRVIEKVEVDLNENIIKRIYRGSIVKHGSKTSIYFSICLTNDSWYSVSKDISTNEWKYD